MCCCCVELTSSRGWRSVKTESFVWLSFMCVLPLLFSFTNPLKVSSTIQTLTVTFSCSSSSLIVFVYLFYWAHEICRLFFWGSFLAVPLPPLCLSHIHSHTQAHTNVVDQAWGSPTLRCYSVPELIFCSCGHLNVWKRMIFLCFISGDIFFSKWMLLFCFFQGKDICWFEIIGWRRMRMYCD